MSVVIPTIEDVVDIARREALLAGDTILGMTAAEPRYVAVPDEEDPEAINEFVVDIWLLESATQIVVLGSATNGLRRVDNVLIANDATGSLVTTALNTPVIVVLSATGQLTVIGRAMVALPTIALDEYHLSSLGIVHTAELEYDSDNGVWRDAFGFVCDINTGDLGTVGNMLVSYTSETTTFASTLEDLDYTDPGRVLGGTRINLGINTLQRSITNTTFAYDAVGGESISASDTETDELS